MAKVVITMEDVGAKTVAFSTEIEGVEAMHDAVTPAMSYAMATRAMYANGMLTEAAGVALSKLGETPPEECILAHFKKIQNEPK